jgi:hypothetical protein
MSLDAVVGSSRGAGCTVGEPVLRGTAAAVEGDVALGQHSTTAKCCGTASCCEKPNYCAKETALESGL